MARGRNPVLEIQGGKNQEMSDDEKQPKLLEEAWIRAKNRPVPAQILPGELDTEPETCRRVSNSNDKIDTALYKNPLTPVSTGEILNQSINQSTLSRKNSRKKERKKEANKKWLSSHPGYMVNRRLWLNGRVRVVEGKRPHPAGNICEVCGGSTGKCLQYHHWDDSDLSKGLWICFRCHQLIHWNEVVPITYVLQRFSILKARMEARKK
jgi:hypothetical protein